MKRIFLGLTIATAMTIMSVFPAFAGTNGQHVEVVDQDGATYHVDAQGTNQNGQGVRVYWIATPAKYTRITPGNWPNYWWRTAIGIPKYDWNGAFRGFSTCDIQNYQPGYDWTDCNIL